MAKNQSKAGEIPEKDSLEKLDEALEALRKNCKITEILVQQGKYVFNNMWIWMLAVGLAIGFYYGTVWPNKLAGIISGVGGIIIGILCLKFCFWRWIKERKRINK